MRVLVLTAIILVLCLEATSQKAIQKPIQKPSQKPNLAEVFQNYAEETDLLVDAALQMVRGFLKKNSLDPMALPDLHIHTTTSVLGITVNIYFDALSLVLNGLSTLQRTDYLHVSLKENNVVNIRAVLHVQDVSVVGQARLKAGIFSTDVASVHIERLQVLAELDLPRDDQSKPTATKFEIQDIGTITIRRGHSGAISSLLDKAASYIANKFRDTMKKEIAPLILENFNVALQSLTTVLF